MRRTIRCPHGFSLEIANLCPECRAQSTGTPLDLPNVSSYDRARYEANKSKQRVYACTLCKRAGHTKSKCAEYVAFERTGKPNPNLKFRPVPVEFAEEKRRA